MKPVMTAWLLALAVSIAVPAQADPPQRIVSAGGDITEIIAALGRESLLVGVDSTSVHPPQMRDLAQIGYVRRLAPEGIISLEPDLVLAAHDAGPPATMDILAAAGVTVSSAPASLSIDAVPAKIRAVADALGLPTEGAALAHEVTEALRTTSDAVARIEARPRVLFVLSATGGGLVVGGRETAIDAMIRAAGGVNVAAPPGAAGLVGWKPMNAEAVIAAAPDVVILSRAHAARMGGVDAVLARADIALTPAGRAGRAEALDGLLLLGMGPRVAQGIVSLVHAIHDPDDIARAGLSPD